MTMKNEKLYEAFLEALGIDFLVPSQQTKVLEKHIEDLRRYLEKRQNSPRKMQMPSSNKVDLLTIRIRKRKCETQIFDDDEMFTRASATGFEREYNTFVENLGLNFLTARCKEKVLERHIENLRKFIKR